MRFYIVKNQKLTELVKNLYKYATILYNLSLIKQRNSRPNIHNKDSIKCP